MTNYSIDNIKPARLKITANGDKLYRGYLKAGAGTSNSLIRIELRFKKI